MRFDLRLALCGLGTLLPVVPIAGRLVQVQVLHHARYEKKAARAYERRRMEARPRGRILDAGGNTLAETVTEFKIFAELPLIADRAAAAERLAPVLGVERAGLRAALAEKSRFATLARGIDHPRAQAVRELGIRGIGITEEPRRFYPNGMLARNVIGLVGREGEGLGGLERRWDEELNGRGRRFEMTRDAEGQIVERRLVSEGEDPLNLQLTLERTIQHYAEDALDRVVAERAAKGGMIVVQDPATGDILALAESPRDPLRNRAVQTVFEPGSTMKVFTMAAVLEEHAVKSTDIVDCEADGRWKLGKGLIIRDHEAEGKLTVSGVLERSSNIGAAKLALLLDPERFFYYVEGFGFGAKTGVGFPAETRGLLRPRGARGEVDAAYAAHGYGLGVSALQLASAYSALANGGALLAPRLVRGVVGPDGRAIEPKPPLLVRQVASIESIATVRAMMEGVVERGTGGNARIDGYRVAGKTGTAQKLDRTTGSYTNQKHLSSFAGFVPASNPRFTVVVLIDEPKDGYYGGDVAAPVFAEVARKSLAYKGVPGDGYRQLAKVLK